MELRDYLKVYWSQRWMIVSFVLVATVVAAVVAGTRPERTGASVSFAINRTNREATTQYQYDGYYALQAADLFAQTVVSWFSTPSVLQEVYQRANIDPEIQTINSLPKRFSVRKYSAQNIVVKYTERTKERAVIVANNLSQVMSAKATDLNQTSDGKALFEIVAGTPVVAPSVPNMMLIVMATAVLSFALALFVAATRHYLR